MVGREHATHARRQRLEDLDPLGHQVGREARHPRDVAVGLREVVDEARGDRIGDDGEDDRDRERRGLCGSRGDRSVGEDEVHPGLRQLFHRRGHRPEVAARESDVEAHVAAFLHPELREPGSEPLDHRGVGSERRVDDADTKPLRRLCRGIERQHRRRAEDQQGDSEGARRRRRVHRTKIPRVEPFPDSPERTRHARAARGSEHVRAVGRRESTLVAQGRRAIGRSTFPDSA